MSGKLLVGVLGTRKAGKSTTWYTLFSRKVKTGKHDLCFGDKEYVEVFIVSGSAEERKKYVGDIITPDAPRIILCAMQYKAEVSATVKYFTERGYFFFLHWLNPGFNDPGAMSDSLGLVQQLLSNGALVGIRNGKAHPENRVREVRDFIYGWAKSRGLVKVKR